MPGLTKLDAVNLMLESINEFPVDSLDTGGTSMAALAERTLDRENQAIQANGWSVNTEYGVTLSESGGEISLSEDVLLVEAADDEDFVVRDQKLYNKVDNSFTWPTGTTIEVVQVRLLDYEKLTVKLRELIAYSAAWKFQRRVQHGEVEDGFLSQELTLKAAEALREDWRSQSGESDVGQLWAIMGPFAPNQMLDTGVLPTAYHVGKLLDQERRQILGRGWHVNTESDVEYGIATTLVAVSNVTGTFLAGETVQESASGATGTYYQINSDNQMELVPTSGTFTGGQTLTGQTSGATATGGVVSAQTASEIVLAEGTLRADSCGGSAWRNVCLREGKLYDLDNHTAVFEDPISLTVVSDLPLTALPPGLRRLVLVAAALRVNARFIRDPAIQNTLAVEHSLALADASREDSEAGDYSRMDTVFTRGITGRRRIPYRR